MPRNLARERTENHANGATFSYGLRARAGIVRWRMGDKRWRRRNQRLAMRNMLFAGLAMISVTVSANRGAAWAQDVAAGEKSFRKCLPCHSIGPAAQNKVGPEQNGLDGRQAGTVPGYTYSQANKNSGIVWNDDTFKAVHRRSARQDPRDQDDLPRHQRPEEADRLVGLHQAVRRRRQHQEVAIAELKHSPSSSPGLRMLPSASAAGLLGDCRVIADWYVASMKV